MKPIRHLPLRPLGLILWAWLDLRAEPINRYSIGDRTKGLKLGADGSLEIYLQHDNPGPDKVSNWLPAPAGPFFFVARLYGPGPSALSGQWQLPVLPEHP